MAKQTAEPPIEWIEDGGQPIALIVRASATAARTSFITPDDFKQQLGFVVYPAGGRILPHAHLPVERHLTGTSEVLVVRSGRMEADLYNDRREIVATRELRAGDVLLLCGAAHGFRLLEDTVLLEVKQGPFTGEVEKERFDP